MDRIGDTEPLLQHPLLTKESSVVRVLGNQATRLVYFPGTLLLFFSSTKWAQGLSLGSGLHF